MHKSILKMFCALKNFIYFLKVLAIFFLMLHLIYWAQNLIGATFKWLQIFVPILSFFNGIGELISKGSIDLFGAVFEFKYGIAVLIYIGLYYFWNSIILFIENIEDKYDDVHRYIKKNEEKVCNITLHTEQEITELKINRYKIAVLTSLKKKFSHKELGYNIEEQNKIMNDFISSKTGVSPIPFEGGFLYEFEDFNHVDSILTVFFKLLKSNTPLNYTICIEVVDGNDRVCLEELSHLISLAHVNKISTFSNCVYRYKFNRGHRFGTSQLGLFQKGNDTLEVHEFIEI